MKKPEKKYSHLQIRLLLSIFVLLCFLFIGFQLRSEFLQKFSQNIIYFHVPVAWGSVTLYVYILYGYMIHVQGNKTLVQMDIFLIGATLGSGLAWEKLVFGEFVFFDVKLASYYTLLVTSVFSLFVRDVNKPLVLTVGLIFYIQSHLASDWVNTVHQKKHMVAVLEFPESFEYTKTLVTFLLFFQTFMFLKLILILNKCFIKPTTTM